MYFDVVKDQKRIDQVFITKSGAPDIRGVTRDISAFAKGELEVLKSYEVAGIRLDRTGLPPAEVAARQNIEGVKTNQLLGSSGGKFRARLIATEVEAVTYATSLAKVIADAETNAERKAHMTQSAAKWESFAGRLDGLMR
ncbi:hypothetical protein DB346_14370 [Verrucomicrobia bacterium LW23]|nr:hypothetical protein DB346_14370 [Verrucomicrobia bacterium LW23]